MEDQEQTSPQPVDYTEALTIHVGTERKEFFVYEGPATLSSETIRAAAATSKSIMLPKATERNFQDYLHWVYKGETAPDPSTYVLVNAFHLGEYLGDIKYCLAVVDTFVELLSVNCGALADFFVFNNTNRKCPLRKVFVELNVHKSVHQITEQFGDYTPRDFIMDIFREKVARFPDSPISEPADRPGLTEMKAICRAIIVDSKAAEGDAEGNRPCAILPDAETFRKAFIRFESRRGRCRCREQPLQR